MRRRRAQAAVAIATLVAGDGDPRASEEREPCGAGIREAGIERD